MCHPRRYHIKKKIIKKKKKKKTSMDQFSKALKKFHQKPLNSKNLQRA